MYEGNEVSPGAAGDERGSGVSPTLIAFIILGVLAIIFVLQNGTKTQIDYLGMNFEAPLWVILAATIAVGVVLDRLFSLWWRRRKRRS